MLLLESQRAALCDGSKIFLQFLAGHAAALVADRKGTRLLIGSDLYGKIVAAESGISGLHCVVVELVRRVAGI